MTQHIKLFEEYNNFCKADETRISIIQNFIEESKNTRNYNTDPPNLDKLIDNWDGYDDLVYMQKTNDYIHYYEGWVPLCWEGAYLKKEYKNLSKEEIIQDILENRFTKIAAHFNFMIEDYGYFKHNQSFIMYVILDTV